MMRSGTIPTETHRCRQQAVLPIRLTSAMHRLLRARGCERPAARSSGGGGGGGGGGQVRG